MYSYTFKNVYEYIRMITKNKFCEGGMLLQRKGHIPQSIWPKYIYIKWRKKR